MPYQQKKMRCRYQKRVSIRFSDMILVPCKPVSVLEQAFAFTNTNHPVQHTSFELATDSTWEFLPWQSRDEDATSSRLANELQLTPASGLADWRDDISPRAPPARMSPAASAICHFPFPVLVSDDGGSNGL